ncbi:hypothetical protein M885DRAFT_541467 [Pelagophyceae sp. CCMP2097]|nr:hypothetical protein M885DRAFT_541467 [Pelagophyceae sp. CCMP2097]
MVAPGAAARGEDGSRKVLALAASGSAASLATGARPATAGAARMLPRPQKAELYDLRQSWKSLALDPIVSNSNYKMHSKRMTKINTTRAGVDNNTPRTMRHPPPQYVREERPPTADERRWRARAAAKRAAEKTPEQHAAEAGALAVLQGRYSLDEGQQATFDNFSTMLADFDLHAMVQILEDALREAHTRSRLSDYGHAATSPPDARHPLDPR